MTTLRAKKRDTKTSGDMNKLRVNGSVPGILYGGSEQNKKIYKYKKNFK